ncbi:DUF3566 domain-containing protein [Corynebacterium argentoratense]|uniref:DUF3566 domain-containing protein n=1 Tax=Corynebacterium argentoratense TaxID=42817 RepID=UPI0028E5A984|nr:DUF3566 domain-containing protein [Corynebacterium argentoratense]
MATTRVLVRRIAPVSAFRTALALSLAGLAAWMICVVLLYFGLDAAGIWAKVNSIIGGTGGSQVVGFGVVISIAAILGVLMSVLFIVLAPLTAVMYNAIVDLFGGVSVTLSEQPRGKRL